MLCVWAHRNYYITTIQQNLHFPYYAVAPLMNMSPRSEYYYLLSALFLVGTFQTVQTTHFTRSSLLLQTQKLTDNLRRVCFEQQILHKPLNQETLQLKMRRVKTFIPPLLLLHALPAEQCIFESVWLGQTQLKILYGLGELCEVWVALPDAKRHRAAPSKRDDDQVLGIHVSGFIPDNPVGGHLNSHRGHGFVREWLGHRVWKLRLAPVHDLVAGFGARGCAQAS